LLKPIRQSISGCRNPREDVHLWPQSRGFEGDVMNRSQDPGIRTRWAAALRAGRRPRLVAAACAVVLAAPLAVVAATGTVAQGRPDEGAARGAGGARVAGAGGRRRPR
jgi:hypothetical protein